MRFAALLLASAWAFACALAYPSPKSVRFYLAANLAYTAGTQPFLYWCGETSHAYALAYYGFASLHFVAAMNVARAEFTRRWHVALGIVAALFVSWRAWAGMSAPIHSYQYFYLIEGAALALAGTVIAYSAARSGFAGVFLSLGFVWLALAVFRIGFALSLTSETWLKLNHVLPTLFVAAGLGWIGMLLIEGRNQVSLQGGGKIE